MHSPNPQQLHVDALLTGFSIKYNNPAYVGEEVAPAVQVKKQSDKYATYGKEHLVIKPAFRARGSEANEVFYTVDTSNTYYCDPYALKEKVTDEDKDNADDPFDPELDATENVSDSIDLNKENRIKTLVMDTGVVPNGAPSAGKWNVAASKPVFDILETACKTIQNAILKFPNVLLLPFNVATALSWNSEILDLVKYTKGDLLTVADGIQLPRVLWGLKVVVAGAGYNTANLGQTASISPLWGNHALVCYVAPSPAKKHISFAYTFKWGAREVKKWYEDKIASTWVQVEEKTDEKIICSDAGYIITNVI